MQLDVHSVAVHELPAPWRTPRGGTRTGAQAAHNPGRPPRGMPSPKGPAYRWAPVDGFADKGEPPPLPERAGGAGRLLSNIGRMKDLPDGARHEALTRLIVERLAPDYKFSANPALSARMFSLAKKYVPW